LSLVYLKLYNGEEILGDNTSIDPDSYCIDNPIQVRIHPAHGLFAKSWLLLAEANSIVLGKSDVLFIGEANERAKTYYETFISRIADSESDTMYSKDDLDDVKDIEDQLLAYLESKTSVKH
jgi:hypothetical protein